MSGHDRKGAKDFSHCLKSEVCMVVCMALPGHGFCNAVEQKAKRDYVCGFSCRSTNLSTGLFYYKRFILFYCGGLFAVIVVWSSMVFVWLIA